MIKFFRIRDESVFLYVSSNFIVINNMIIVRVNFEGGIWKIDSFF